MQLEIANYLSKVAEGNLSEGSSNKIRGLLSVNNDLERIGDLFYQISLNIQRKNEDDIRFTEYQSAQLTNMFGLIENAYETMLMNLKVDYKEMTIKDALQKEKEIDVLRNELRRSQLKNIEKGNYDLPSGLIYSDIFLTLERIGDHIFNVTEALMNKSI
jgi:phosphate:Na+ symporter